MKKRERKREKEKTCEWNAVFWTGKAYLVDHGGFFAQTVDYCMPGLLLQKLSRPFCCVHHGFETLPPKNLVVPCV